MASWEGAKRSLAKASDCTLVIGMHTSPGRGLLPKVRAMMVASCPDVELELRQVGWGDRTAGLADRSTDAAFVWLPLPQPPYRWVTIAREPRLVALPNDHRARRARERRRWPTCSTSRSWPCPRAPARCATTGSPSTSATGARSGSRPRSTTPRRPTRRSRAASASACSRPGNAPIFARGDVTMLPVRDLSPSELVLAWNERHCPPLLETFAALCEEVTAGGDGDVELSPPWRRAKAS